MFMPGFTIRENGAVAVDWMFISMVTMAIALAAVSFVRTDSAAFNQASLHAVGGVPVLSSQDRLVAFEDFGRAAIGWNPARRDDSVPGFSGILGRFGGSESEVPVVTKTYSLAPGFSHVLVELDLHAIDDWMLEDLILYANGMEIARSSFSTRPDLQADQSIVVTDMHGYAVTATDLGALDRGYGSGSLATEDQVLHILAIIEDPGKILELGFGTTLTRAMDEASWAIDNVSVILTNEPPD